MQVLQAEFVHLSNTVTFGTCEVDDQAMKNIAPVLMRCNVCQRFELVLDLIADTMFTFKDADGIVISPHANDRCDQDPNATEKYFTIKEFYIYIDDQRYRVYDIMD